MTAPPADGEANEAVVRLLAKALSVAKSRVEIVSGHSSRVKKIAIEGLSAHEAISRLQAADSPSMNE